MNSHEIIAFVRSNIEPLPALAPYGVRYRVSATLTDGTVLPCVVIEGAEPAVDLALKRFEDTRNSKNPSTGYRNTVKAFVARGNTLNDHDLSHISVSAHAIPLARLAEIGGETSMGWTEFYARMKDGKRFRFGTTFFTEFFTMPAGYAAADIVKITPAVRGIEPGEEKIHRERPFFTCYVDGL